MYYLINSKLEYLGHDEYGLRRGGLIFIVLLLHVLSIFIFALLKKIIKR